MLRRSVEGIKSLFHTQGLGWGVLFLVVGLVGLGALAALWSSFRDSLSDVLGYVGDFLRSDVEVWHLLLGVLLAVVIADMAAAAFVVWWTHRRPVGTAPPQTAVPVKKQTPFVISDKVRWEDTGNYVGGGMQVYGPLCPKDYTPLRYVNHRSTWGESKTEGIGENDLVSEDHGSLICLTCDETYYFNGEGLGKTVELARAEARTRLYGMRNRDET